jgi:hypothetical protein
LNLVEGDTAFHAALLALAGVADCYGPSSMMQLRLRIIGLAYATGPNGRYWPHCDIRGHPQPTKA